MDWLFQLFTEHSIAQTIAVYSLIISIGIMLGRIQVYGLSLGITWILFAGIIASYFGLSVDDTAEQFLRDFGLILFVYSIGLQVGPGFFASLKRNAITNNLLSASVVALGMGITILFHLGLNRPIGVMAGLMSGAVTNTPGLGAAQQAMKDLRLDMGDPTLLPLAYAVAYPFGVFGIILSLFTLKKIFGISIERETRFHHKLSALQASGLVSVHLTVENRQLAGHPIKELQNLLKEPIIITRMMHNGEVITPSPDTPFLVDDVVLIVAPRRLVNSLKVLVGGESPVNLKAAPGSRLVDRLIVVTQPEVTHRRMGAIPQLRAPDFTISRLIRAGIEIMPDGNTFLQLGDTVKVVGSPDGVNNVARVLGNSLKKLDMPDIAPIFMGIVLGVILGSIPIHIPNIPVPVKIGLAGGPLIISLLLSRFGGMLYLNNYTTNSANLMIRELGIALFLASVGLASGQHLSAAFEGGRGWVWLGMGAIITFVPLMTVGLIARRFFRKSFFEICGLLAGAATDPPALAFAVKMTASDIPSTTYATVYPLTMILRIIAAQALILLFAR